MDTYSVPPGVRTSVRIGVDESAREATADHPGDGTVEQPSDASGEPTFAPTAEVLAVGRQQARRWKVLLDRLAR